MAAMTMSTKITTVLSTNIIIITTSTRIAFPKYLETSSKTAPDIERVQDAMPRAFLPQSLSLHPNPPPSAWMRSHPMAWQGLCRPMCRLRHPLLSQQVPGVSTWRREHSHMSGRVAHVSIRRSTDIQPRPRKPRIAIASHTLGRVVELQDHLGGIACQMSLRDVNQLSASKQSPACDRSDGCTLSAAPRGRDARNTRRQFSTRTPPGKKNKKMVPEVEAGFDDARSSKLREATLHGVSKLHSGAYLATCALG